MVRNASDVAGVPLAGWWAGAFYLRPWPIALERSRPWQLPAPDAGQLLLDFAQAPGYLATVQASMVDVPGRLERITCPVLSCREPPTHWSACNALDSSPSCTTPSCGGSPV